MSETYFNSEQEGSMENHIDPSTLRSYEVTNYLNPGDKIVVHPVDADFSINDAQIEEIADICSQPEVYEMLFKQRFSGRPYSTEDAKWFVDWARLGWAQGEYFVFLSKDSEDHVVSAIDIKSDNPQDAEIGYWADKNKPGYVTNMLVGLVELAKHAGYKSLVAYTRKDNEKSQRVLLRAGFVEAGEENTEEGLRLKFTRELR